MLTLIAQDTASATQLQDTATATQDTKVMTVPRWTAQLNQTVTAKATVILHMTHHAALTVTKDTWALLAVISVCMALLILKIQCASAHKPVITVLAVI